MVDLKRSAEEDMVIAPDKVDAYLQAKGIASRMSDPEWSSAIEVLSQYIGGGRAFQVKLLHQKEDSLRRFSCSFPESIPQPYRFIDYIRFVVGDSSSEVDLISTLKNRAIPFHLVREKNGPNEDDVVSLIYVGPSK